jgi:uncharacterized protein
MTVLAIVAGADLGFVIVHHVLRVLIVISGAPFAARLLRRRGCAAGSGGGSASCTPPRGRT